jgi:redox-sensitive bicupin YhaK (pirin superfamily)
MIELRPFSSLGGDNHGWLNTKHDFSLANYYNPKRMNWGQLRVWNDDEIQARTGFPAHPHADMAIITYVRGGAITHQDSMGNKGRTEAGDVQVMSAGSGIRHSGYTVEEVTTRIFQISIQPTTRGGTPSWGAEQFPKTDRSGQFLTLASGFESDKDALSIRAEARVMDATVNAGQKMHLEVDPSRHLYLVAARGAIEIGGIRVNARNGAAIKGVTGLDMVGIEDAEIVLVDAV